LTLLSVPFLLSGVKRSFEPGVLRRNGRERRNERSNAQLSDFYKFENRPALAIIYAQLPLARRITVAAREKK